MNPLVILLLCLLGAAIAIAGGAAIYRTVNQHEFDNTTLPISDTQRAYMRHVRSRTTDQELKGYQPRPYDKPPFSPVTTTQSPSTYLS